MVGGKLWLDESPRMKFVSGRDCEVDNSRVVGDPSRTDYGSCLTRTRAVVQVWRSGCRKHARTHVLQHATHARRESRASELANSSAKSGREGQLPRRLQRGSGAPSSPDICGRKNA